MEVQDWIDGINYPEWGRNPRQIYGPGDAPYSLSARYSFSVANSGTNSNMTMGNPYQYASGTYSAMKKRATLPRQRKH